MMIPTWRGRLVVKIRKIPNQNSYHLKMGVNHSKYVLTSLIKTSVVAPARV